MLKSWLKSLSDRLSRNNRKRIPCRVRRRSHKPVSFPSSIEFLEERALLTGITIVPTFDASIPTGSPLYNTIQTAVSLYSNYLTDPISVNISFSNQVGVLESTNVTRTPMSYATFHSELVGGSSLTDANQQAAINSLPTPGISGVEPVFNLFQTIDVPTAELNALAFANGKSTTVETDGTVTVDANQLSFTPQNPPAGKYDALSLVEAQINQVLGLTSGLDDPNANTNPNNPGGFPWVNPMDLFRYANFGQGPVRSESAGTPSAFFTIDNGTTDIKDFNQTAGLPHADWLFTNPLQGYFVQDAQLHAGLVPQVMNMETGTQNAVFTNFKGSLELGALDVIGYHERVPTVPQISGNPTNTYESGSHAIVVAPTLSTVDTWTGQQYLSATVQGNGFNYILQATSAAMGHISPSVSAGALTLTDTGPQNGFAAATSAQWISVLESVTAEAVGGATFGNGATFGGATFQVFDGTQNSNSFGVSDVPHVAPQLTLNSSAVIYGLGSGAQSVSSNLTILDTSVPGLASGAVKVFNYQAGDSLSFTASGNIVGSFDNNTGILSLSSQGATATIAQWQSTLDSVQYTYSGSASAINGSKTITFQVNDGMAIHNLSNVVSANVILIGGAETTNFTSYVALSAPVAVASDLVLADTNTSNAGTATVTIATNYNSGHDFLTLPSNANFSGRVNGATLTLLPIGQPTLAQLQAALESVTYSNNALGSAPTRAIQFQFNDGLYTSNVVTKTIQMSHSAPVLGSGGNVNYIAASTGVAVAPAITVSDASVSTLAAATVTIANYTAGDVLSFTNGTGMGNIAVGSNNNGVLTLTSAGASATLANWQAALQAVQYSFTGSTLPASARSVSIQVDDGTGVDNLSNTVTSTIQVIGAVEPTTTPLNYVALSPSTVVSTDLQLTDTGAQIVSATAQITSNYVYTRDFLTFTNGTFNGTFNYSNGTMTIVVAGGGSASVASFQSALQTIGYLANDVGVNNTRQVSYSFVDANGVTSNVAVRGIVITGGAPPTVNVTNGTTNTQFNQHQGPVVLAPGGVVLTDTESTQLTWVTVTISANFNSASDVLSYTGNSSYFTATWDGVGGILTLKPAPGNTELPLSLFQTAINQIDFNGTSDNPGVGIRRMTYQISDDDADSTLVGNTNQYLYVNVSNAPPTVGETGSTSYSKSGQPVAIVSSGSISDSDANNLASVTVQIGNTWSNLDSLTFTNGFSNISANWSASTGKLTLSGLGTPAQYSAILATLKFSTTGPTGLRTFTITALDDTYTPLPGVGTVYVTVGN